MTKLWLLLILAMILPKHTAPPEEPPFIQRWEGRFAFTGNYPDEHIIVVQECFPLEPYDLQNWAEHGRFCEYAGGITKRPEFCFTTSVHRDRSRCEDILEQNTRWYQFFGEIISYPPKSIGPRLSFNL